MEKFGEKLKHRRIQKGLSQPQLATEARTSTAHISRLENGKAKEPSAQLLYKLACVLNLSMEYLMNDDIDVGAPSFESERVLDKIRMIYELNDWDRKIAIAVIDSLYQKKMIADNVARTGDYLSLTTASYMPGLR